MLLLALLPSASARDVVHIALAHEWSERYTRDAGQMGPSIRADLGYGFGIGIGKLIPEVGTSIAYESGVVIPRAGVRAILGWLVTPGVYAHGNLALGGPFASPAPGFDAGSTQVIDQVADPPTEFITTPTEAVDNSRPRTGPQEIPAVRKARPRWIRPVAVMAAVLIGAALIGLFLVLWAVGCIPQPEPLPTEDAEAGAVAKSNADAGVDAGGTE